MRTQGTGSESRTSRHATPRLPTEDEGSLRGCVPRSSRAPQGSSRKGAQAFSGDASRQWEREAEVDAVLRLIGDLLALRRVARSIPLLPDGQDSAEWMAVAHVHAQVAARLDALVLGRQP